MLAKLFIRTIAILYFDLLRFEQIFDLGIQKYKLLSIKYKIFINIFAPLSFILIYFCLFVLIKEINFLKILKLFIDIDKV